MIPKEFDSYALRSAVERGGLSDLRFACEFVERVVSIVEMYGDTFIMDAGQDAFRARNGYTEVDDDVLGTKFVPLEGDAISAPPAETTSLGRFNQSGRPVLYMSTTPEVALAECRTLPSETCTVANFKTKRKCRIAQFLRHEQFSKGTLAVEKTKRGHELWLLYEMSKFLSRRVEGGERELHYKTCNLVASAFSERNYDGLLYRTSFWSSLWKEENEKELNSNIRSSNIVLFDPLAAYPESSKLYSLNWNRPRAEPPQRYFQSQLKYSEGLPIRKSPPN